MMRPTFVIVVAVCVLASGCATITTDSTQSLRIETFNDKGQEIKGAQCRLENDKGAYSVTTPGSVTVRKSSNDLMVTCTAQNHSDAKAVVTSRVGAGMFGNIVFGGGVGAIIDHSKGTAYNYPTWVQLVFGKLLSFDRQDFKEGEPTPGFELNEGKRQAYVRPGASTGTATPNAATK